MSCVFKKRIVLFAFMGLMVLASCVSHKQLISAEQIYQGIYDINVSEQQWKNGPAPNRIENEIPSYHEYKLGLQEIKDDQKH